MSTTVHPVDEKLPWGRATALGLQHVLVMYAGRTMEYGKVNDIFYRPSHPYTEGLLKAIPRLDSEGEVLATIPGNPPNLLRLPKGCPFQERCHRVRDICRTQAPELASF